MTSNLDFLNGPEANTQEQPQVADSTPSPEQASAAMVPADSTGSEPTGAPQVEQPVPTEEVDKWMNDLLGGYVTDFPMTQPEPQASPTQQQPIPQAPIAPPQPATPPPSDLAALKAQVAQLASDGDVGAAMEMLIGAMEGQRAREMEAVRRQQAMNENFSRYCAANPRLNQLGETHAGRLQGVGQVIDMTHPQAPAMLHLMLQGLQSVQDIKAAYQRGRQSVAPVTTQNLRVPAATPESEFAKALGIAKRPTEILFGD